MNAIKKIIPAAIALALAGAAQAEVSVYGLVDMSYGKNEFIGDQKATIHSGGDDFSSQGNSTTRIGVKGSADIGNGVKANFKFETGGIDSAGGVNAGSNVNSNGNFFNRQAWLGLSGSLGEVRVGRQDSVPFQMMGQFDFNGQSNGVTSAWSGIGLWNTGRQSRSLQYMSPEMSGFKAHVGYVPKDGNNPSGTPASSANEEATYSGAVTYAAGALAIGASYESERIVNGSDFASAAVSYDFKVLKVMAGYTEIGRDETVVGSTKHNGPTVGVVAPIAGFSVGAHYAKDSKGDKDSVLELFVNKEVFKNTYGYAEFGKMSSNDNTTLDGDPAKDNLESYSVGLIYVF